MAGRPSIPPEKLATLVHPRERILLWLVLLAGVGIYFFTAISLLGSLAAMAAPSLLVDPANPAASAASAATTAKGAGVLLIYVPAIIAFYIVIHGHFVGHLRGNGVRVTEQQFPTIHQLVLRHARALGLEPVPPVYIVQAGGVLNAFVTRFFSRAFVVLYSDIVSLAQDRGEDALGFVVAHELAHIKRGHLRHRWLKIPGHLVPYLGKAYSRACEYTCDRFSAECGPEGAVRGLLVLAAGKSLYRDVNAGLFAAQAETETGFWVRHAELTSTHPRLPKRVAALRAAGIPEPMNYY